MPVNCGPQAQDVAVSAGARPVNCMQCPRTCRDASRMGHTRYFAFVALHEAVSERSLVDGVAIQTVQPSGAQLCPAQSRELRITLRCHVDGKGREADNHSRCRS